MRSYDDCPEWLPGVALSNSADVSNFQVGHVITFERRPRWWVRLWRWLTRYNVRRRRLGLDRPLVVAAVDGENGAIRWES